MIVSERRNGLQHYELPARRSSTRQCIRKDRLSFRVIVVILIMFDAEDLLGAD